MQAAALVVFLGVLVAPLYGGPLPSEPLLPTQENFDLDRFMGKWYDVAKASNCPWMQKHKGQHRDSPSPVGTLQLEKSTTDTISATRTMSRHGTCKQISASYKVTETSGRFKYHVSRWNADVDAYVVHTNYDEYALIVSYKQKQGSDRTTSVKLYGRTPELRATLIDDFKRVVREQGMSEDTISIKQNKGECTPGETVVVAQRSRRAAGLLPQTDDEGSGDITGDTPLFKGPESCQATPDSGPCFGMFPRFYYNSSLMACQVFNFGGCLGNQNNFVTEKECLQSCRTEAACRLPIDAGSCNTHVELWAFDANAGKCVSFKYGGCQGNGNKFYSQKECEEYCGVMRDGDDELLKVN